MSYTVQGLIESGEIVDFILVAMLFEALLLMFLRRTTGRGIASAQVCANLAAGAVLMLALRAALKGAGWQTVAAWLAAALLAHVVEVAVRWR